MPSYEIPTSQELSTLVKLFRDIRRWTQETLAELSGLTVRTTLRVEKADLKARSLMPLLNVKKEPTGHNYKGNLNYYGYQVLLPPRRIFISEYTVLGD